MNNDSFYTFHRPCSWLDKSLKKLLDELGIATKITAYSYQRGDYAYLEEDCDATLFVEEYEKQTGKNFQSVTSYATLSAIRNYQTYQP